MITQMRAKDLVARLLNKRADYESCKAYSDRLKLPFTLTYGRLFKMRDMTVGLFYQILKGNGYVLMAYNPNPPEGMSKTYIINNTYAPVKPKERDKKIVVRKDPYTNELFRKKRRYKKSEYKKFTRTDLCQKAE